MGDERLESRGRVLKLRRIVFRSTDDLSAPGSVVRAVNAIVQRCRAIGFHWLFTTVLATCLIPAFFYLNLPLNFEWNTYLTIFSAIGLQTIPLLIALYLIGFPLRETFGPLWSHYSNQKPRLIIIAAFAVMMAWEFGVFISALLTVFTVILLEIVDRTKGSLQVVAGWMKAASALCGPAAYLFAGFMLVFAYNDIIAASRFTAAYDPVFQRMDAWILGGTSISEIAHPILDRLSPGVFHAFEFVYYRMFPQMGVGLALVALCDGRKQAFRYVGTILTAYYLSLVVFALWPSLGPFWGCAMHFSRFPESLTASIQAQFVSKTRLLWEHKGISSVSADFYISFPCMHIAQPLIVLWFLRRWKRIVICLVLHDLLLIPAILLLEWHYVVDLFGGVIVAILAIILNRRVTKDGVRDSLSMESELKELVVQ